MKINIFFLAKKSVVCLNSSQVLILASLHCLNATPYATFIYYVNMEHLLKDVQNGLLTQKKFNCELEINYQVITSNVLGYPVST